MDEITAVFMSLLSEADLWLREDPFAEQVIVAETAKGNRYHCLNHEIMDGNRSDETAFIEKLQDAEDTTVSYLVSVWNRDKVNCMSSDLYPVDLPSFHFRQQLLEISSENAHTRILLRGKDGYGYKALAATMPSPTTL